ncbi:MAG: SUMF1/EgtB/PvdO family nonheme iron enzyme, partial [Anaerolineales bacterium]|nr:SUMF1/EgtB/PvdO family nonheme iron enzyme [Anaerolineales bacterium]
MRVNPYIAGNPIGEEDGFFGREDIFRDVLQVLNHPRQNAIVLYGQRRIGKTSVLLQLEQRLAAEGDFTPVYFDLMDRADKPLKDVLFALALRISAVLNLRPPDPQQFDNAGDYFRQTYLPEVATAGNGRDLVLLFDEFDTLDNPNQNQAGEAFFPYLRRWMTSIEGVQFIFVIGRRPEDLSINTLSTFKNVKSSQVALLTKRDALAVIRQAADEGSLLWPDAAVESVWEWTQGHPYFTQLLCETTWNLAQREADKEIPTATPELIDAALQPALVAGSNAFVWLWNGLPPAERVVMAAIAEAESTIITQEELVGILNRSGVRLIVAQLELAPETLEAWGLLVQTDGGYRFAVPLLRHWVRKNRPLNRVKEELDRLEPAADNLFQIGQFYYSQGNLDEAQNQLQRALEINPNHLKAQLLLGQVFLDKDQTEMAVETLQAAYDYDRRASRAVLVTALLKMAETQSDESEQLITYNHILEIAPGNTVAENKKVEIHTQQWQAKLVSQATKAIQSEGIEDWFTAAKIYTELEQGFPQEDTWSIQRKHAETQLELQQKYNQALGALETGDTTSAQALLLAIMSVQPNYKDAPRYYLQATEDIDVTALQQQADASVPRQSFWRILAIVGGATLLLGLLIGGFGGWRLRGSQIETAPTNFPTATETMIPTQTPTNTATPDPFMTPLTATPGTTWTRPVDNMEMVFVPAGSFMMGSDPDVDSNAQDDEQPQHEVSLDAFWIDKYEVTNAQFADFLNAEGNQEEDGSNWFDIDASSARISEVQGEFSADEAYTQHPVVEVSWYGAKAYCEWVGGQLPTEAQWEYAARGENSSLYPWGSSLPSCDLANYGNCSGGSTLTVGSLSPAGDSWVDAADMAGNVWEWVADWYASYPEKPQTNPTGPDSGSSKVLRGGAWFINLGSFIRAAYRLNLDPTFTRYYTGLRCAQE